MTMTSTPPTPPPPKRRVRSEAQLNQKRLTDRIKHKENRHENKQRLEKMESDLASMHSKLDSLALQLQSLPLALTAPTTTPPVLGHSRTISHAAYGHISQHFPANVNLPPPDQAYTHTQPPSNIVTKIWGYTPTQHGSSRDLDCRCGLRHPDNFSCLENCNVTALYRSHMGAVAGPTSPFPRNPSLPSMMLYQSDENILTFFITGFLQQCRARSIEQLLGFYLLGYRYMRVSGTSLALPPSPEPIRRTHTQVSVANESQCKHDSRHSHVDLTDRGSKDTCSFCGCRFSCVASVERLHLHEWRHEPAAIDSILF